MKGGAMKNWGALEPDHIKFLNKHFTPSRGGDRDELIKAVGEHE